MSTATATTSASTTRLCTCCGQDKPLTQFRRVRKGSDARRRECDQCHYRRCQVYQDRKRRKQVSKDLTALKNARSASQLQVVINAMLKRWGGVPGMVETWWRFMESTGPADSYHMKSLFAMLNMMLKFAQMKVQTPLEDLSDEQLARVIRNELATLLVEQPDVLADVLQEQGWTVVGPHGGADAY